MSTEEQDLILGRLTRESGECRRNIAALEAKLSGFSRSLNAVVLKLNGTWNPKPKPVTSVDEAKACLSEIPDRQGIIDTLTDLQKERERMDQITAQLSRMNP